MVAPLALFALGALGAGAMEYGNRKSAKAAEEDRAKALQRAVEYSGILGQPRAPGIMGGAAKGPTMANWSGLPRTQQENGVLRNLQQAGYGDEVVKMIQGRMAPQQRAQPLSSEGKQAWDMGLRPGTPAWNNFMSTATAPKPEAPPGTKPAFDTQTQRPVFVTNDQIFKYPDRFQPVQSGMEIESDGQGGLRLRTNVPGNASPGNTNSTQGKLESAQLDAYATLDRLGEIEASFKPEYLTYGGRIEALKLGGADKINPDLLNEDDRRYLSEYTEFRSNALRNVNAIIKEITGAALSEAEAKRILASLPNPGVANGPLDILFGQANSPTEFKTNLDVALKDVRRAIIRNQIARERGISGLDQISQRISLDAVDGLIEEEGMRIMGRLRQENPNVDDELLKAQADSILANKYLVGQ